MSTGHRAPVSAAAVSADQRVFASASYDHDILLWSAASGAVLARIQAHRGLVNALDWAPDGSALASASSDRSARLWHPLTGEPLALLQGHTDDVNGVRFSPDGARLATASFDGSVRVWTRGGQPLLIAAHHGCDVNGVAWFPDAARLAAASDDGTVSIFDAESGRVRRILTGHTDWVDQVSVHPSGHLLASASLDRTVRIWNVATGQTVAQLCEAECVVKDVAFSRDGTRLATTAYDGAVRIYDTERWTLLHAWRAEGLWNRTIAFTQDGVLTGSFGGGPVELGPHGVRRLGREVTHGLNGFALSPDGSEAAACSDDGRLYRIDLRGHTVGGVLAEHPAAVLCAAYSPDGTRVATGSWDRSVCVWQTHGGALLARFEAAHEPINGVLFDADGQRVWIGTFNGDVLLWDPRTGAAQRHGAHAGSVKALERAPAGAWSVGRDGWVRRWSTAERREHGFATGSPILNGVAWAPRCGQLATVSRRGGLQVWSGEGHRILQVEQHPCSAKSVAWSADERRLAAAYYDGHIALVCPDERLVRVDRLCDAALSQIRFSGDDLLVSAWDAAGTLHRIDTRRGTRDALRVAA